MDAQKGQKGQEGPQGIGHLESDVREVKLTRNEHGKPVASFTQAAPGTRYFWHDGATLVPGPWFSNN